MTKGGSEVKESSSEGEKRSSGTVAGDGGSRLNLAGVNKEGGTMGGVLGGRTDVLDQT